MKAQRRAGKRGDVFSLRLTDRERVKLEGLQRELGGPRSLGPWILWRALSPMETRDAQLVLPIQAAAGSVDPSWAVVPELTAGEPMRAIFALATAPFLSRTPAEAVEVFRERLARIAALSGRRTRPIPERLILDLCAGSGAWSEPYVRAGYRVMRVTLPAHDVRLFTPPQEPVWGVLAAPPCGDFTLARNDEKDLGRNYRKGLEVVAACMRLILTVRPVWWALENPVGKLSAWLGTPTDVFQPSDFGDPWHKRTALWGSFTIPTRGPFVEALGAGPFCRVCDPKGQRKDRCRNHDHRAITPAGFARAFCEANP